VAAAGGTVAFLAACQAVTRFALGWGPLLPAPAGRPATPLQFAAYALLAVVVVLLARDYVAAFHRTTGWFHRLPLPGPVKHALGAGAAALLGVALYEAAGQDTRALAVLGFGLGTLQEALAHLHDLVGLEVLVLSGNDITNVGLARLAKLTGLMGLFLNSTKVTDAGLDHLRGMSKMTKLSLSKTAVTDAGVEKLKKVLPFYATIIREKGP
jgi:hypothetical protein